MQIGIGLDVRLKQRFTLRGEARDFWSGTPDILVDTGKSRQHNYLVGGGDRVALREVEAVYLSSAVVISSYNSGSRRASSDESPNRAAS